MKTLTYADATNLAADLRAQADYLDQMRRQACGGMTVLGVIEDGEVAVEPPKVGESA